MLILQDNTMEKICSHAQLEYPKECCGIMLGKRQDEQRIVYRIVHSRNMAEGSQSKTYFLINPLEIVKAELLAENDELEIVGFYHSHPNYDAAASNADILHMIEGYSYSIISVKDGICGKVKSFEKLIQTDFDAKEEEILVKEK